ncbi:S-adenosyl-L-methionine-dependent methyltransferase [Gloeopeniophorella convolvens]|nr:S-adenosyl-L-methionine-dependent methyltransferase [Gloeopeniophorella convolvens]
MAAYANATFNTARYAAARPTYPKQLFEFVFDYHRREAAAKFDTAVDIGCGTGTYMRRQATAELTPFRRVIGVDRSTKMLDSARAAILNSRPDDAAKFRFESASAEHVPVLQDGSVDLIVAGASGSLPCTSQAAHWFDFDKAWPEFARLLRPGGSVALWGYSELRLTHFPSLAPLIKEYLNGTDLQNSIGPYWEQPGRGILDGHLLQVPSARDVLPDKFSEFKRVFFTDDRSLGLPAPRPALMRKRMSWDGFLSWLNTMSALHTFHERVPADKARADGDIATRFWQTLRVATGNAEDVELEWTLTLLLARRA